ncbi:MAG: nuclear transport factor 2 family protein [Chromatiales bacterium]|nr:nuclear transport factor 2 family protein [Chromatiales bacterium]
MTIVKLVFSSPEAAEEAFYRAMQKGDLQTMMAVWAEDDNISCVHPGGPRLEGRAAVRASFERILAASPGMQFRLSDLSQYYDRNLAVRVLHENIRLGKDSHFQPPVVTTNIYRLTDNGWRMVMHHASSTRTASAPSASLH